MLFQHLIKYLILSSSLMFLVIANEAFSQVDYDKLFPSPTYKSQYEIGLISFRGNDGFAADMLENIILSKTTDRSLPFSLYEFTYSNTKNSSLVPSFIKKDIEKNLQTYQNDIHYFLEDAVDVDISNLRQFYNQRGYHDVKISYRFVPNYQKRLNELVFFIKEGNPYILSHIDFIIKDSLPNDINNEIKNLINIKSGDAFNELRILNTANQIVNRLRQSGYYFSTYSQPQVIIEKSEPKSGTDSVIVEISPGPRCKITKILFKETLNNQKALASSMTAKQLEISVSDWYSSEKISKSESNFLSLNTFQYVRIDTLAYNPIDSTLELVIDLRYKKQQEYGFSAFTNRTMFDKYWNAGVELSYSHKNAFGAAQVFNPFARFVVLDISRAIYDLSKTEYEYQFGINLSQPILWTPDQARIGVLTQIMYSKRTIYNELKLSTFSFPIKFPVSLPKWTYFNLGSAELSIERQVPDNYPTAINSALSLAENAQDTVDIYKKFLQFSGLYDFVAIKNPWFTSTMIGLNIAGDNRNDPFSPSAGHYTSINLDISPFAVNRITGLSNFAKLQFLYTSFHKMNAQAVLALKFRAGHILWFDRSNSIIPYEKQFFAGGANSIRGWSSRRLRYFGESQKDVMQNEYLDFAQDFIGSTSIIEGSIEWRYKLAPPGSRKAFEQILQDVGIAFFLDFGNAYQWFLYQDDKDYTYKPKLMDYLKGIALAGGIGVRYDTPVGVVRLDFGWKLFDPNSRIDPDLFPATSKLKDFQFHIGLGNPF